MSDKEEGPDDFILRLLLHGGVRCRDLTEDMMRAFVERADGSDDLPPEVQYFVEPFRAFLGGQSINAALHLDKRNKRIESANRDYRIAATFKYFRDVSKMSYEEALGETAARFHKSDKTVEAACAKWGEPLRSLYVGNFSPSVLTYEDYLRAAAALEKFDENK